MKILGAVAVVTQTKVTSPQWRRKTTATRSSLYAESAKKVYRLKHRFMNDTKAAHRLAAKITADGNITVKHWTSVRNK